MHIPLMVAVLAVLALALLLVLDRPVSTESDDKGITALVARIARWTKG